MFDLGTQELIVIFIVAFLVFGPKKLPELGRTLGKGIRELKSAMRGVTDSLHEADSDLTDGLKQAKDDLEESVFKSINSNINSKEKETEGVKDKEDSQEEESDSMTAKDEKKETDKDG